MEIKYLKTFKTIIDTGSFQKAAESLNYAPSTVTFQIQQLEEELSTKLFEKIGRRMMLTKAGHQLIPYVDSVLIALQQMHQFGNNANELEGDVVVGVAETMLCYKLAPLIQKFHAIAPKARLILHSMNCYEIRDEIINGSLDLGVFYQDIRGLGDNLAIHSVGQYPLTLVASPSTKKEYCDFITPDQQLSVPFIINEPKCVYRQLFEEYIKERDISIDYTIELWSIPTIKNLVKNNFGISFLPKFTVQEEIADKTLEEIETDLTNATLTAVCAHHKNKWISPVMKLFIELCKEFA